MIYTFKLTSARTEIALPISINQAKHLKILSMRFKTASANNTHMQVLISSYCKNYYYDGVNLDKITKLIYLSDASGVVVEYGPLDNTPDVVLNDTETKKLSSLIVELKIDRNYSSDISPSNPVHLELHFY